MSYIYLVHTFISMQTILMHTPVFQCCIFCGAHLYFNAAYFVVHLYFNAAYFVVHTCISILLILWHTLVFQCCIFCGAHLYFSDCSLQTGQNAKIHWTSRTGRNKKHNTEISLTRLLNLKEMNSKLNVINKIKIGKTEAWPI